MQKESQLKKGFSIPLMIGIVFILISLVGLVVVLNTNEEKEEDNATSIESEIRDVTSDDGKGAAIGNEDNDSQDTVDNEESDTESDIEEITLENNREVASNISSTVTNSQLQASSPSNNSSSSDTENTSPTPIPNPIPDPIPSPTLTPSISISVSPNIVEEGGDERLVYTVSRNSIVVTAITVNVSIGGTATNGVDYLFVNNTVIIPAGETSATITVNPNEDSIEELNESMSISLLPGIGYTLGFPNSSMGTIKDTTNPIIGENLLAAVSESVIGFNSVGNGTDGFYGFSREYSVNAGETIDFSVDGINATNLAIYRAGHYEGSNWREITTIPNTPVEQGNGVVLPDTNGATSMANWSITSSWDTPADMVSGKFVAVVRDSSNTPRSWIPFIVRNDGREADIVIRMSDATWGAAYNFYGTPANPLTGKSIYGIGGGSWNINDRSVAVSYDRPILTRGVVVNHWDVHELALIDWVEKNGYDVKYIGSYDMDQQHVKDVLNGSKILVSAGHDEYWSEDMLNNTEEFVNEGGHFVSMSGNTLFWKIRWEDNGRVMICYKDTMPGPTGLRTGGAGTPLDPVSWTGTWRDTRWTERRPENLLLGSTFRMNGIRNETMVINGSVNQNRPFWRNTDSVANGNNLTVPEVVGFEADSIDFPHGGGVVLGATDININGSYADDNGQTYNGNGTLNWGITAFYPQLGSQSGLSVNFNSNQWMWGLSNYHSRGSRTIANRDMRQATYNLFNDLGASPSTPENDIILSNPVSLSSYGAIRVVNSVSLSASPSEVEEDVDADITYTVTRTGSTLNDLTVNYTIGGSAINGTDYDTISSSVVIPSGSSSATIIVSPITDSSVESDETITITLTNGTGYKIVTPNTSTTTILNDDIAPPDTFLQLLSDSIVNTTATVDSSNYELGTAFFIDQGNALLTGVKFYRPPVNTNSQGLAARTWTVRLWGDGPTPTTTILATATVSTEANETGWISAEFSSPVVLGPRQNYFVSYTVPADAGYMAIVGQAATPIASTETNLLAADSGYGKFSETPGERPGGSFGNSYYGVQPIISAQSQGISAETLPINLESPTNSAEGPYELGQRYSVTEAETIVGVTLWQPLAETGTRTVKIWNESGIQIGSGSNPTSATSINIGGSWVYYPLDTPVALTAGQTFTVSYNNNTYVGLSVNITPPQLPRAMNRGTKITSSLNLTPNTWPSDIRNNAEYYVYPHFAL